MIFIHPALTELFSETEFDIQFINIGHFHENLSHLQTSDKEVIFERVPFLFNDRSKYILLNKNDELLIESLNSVKKNYKVLSYEIKSTDLSKEVLEDTFKLIDIKYRFHKDLEAKIQSLIIDQNHALNCLCTSKQKQLGYINKNFLMQKISSQTLSRINKEIDIKLCNEVLSKRNLFDIDEDKLKLIIKKMKENNRRLFLSDIISIMEKLDISDIYDVDLVCDYIIKEKFNEGHLLKMKDFFSRLYEEFKILLPTKKLFQLISRIEKIKRETEEENYNFFMSSWTNQNLNQNSNQDSNQNSNQDSNQNSNQDSNQNSNQDVIIDYLIKHIKLNEQ